MQKVPKMLIGTKVRVAAAHPPDACMPLQNDVMGMVVVATRGNCSFPVKARSIQAAGGVLAVVANSGGKTPTVIVCGPGGTHACDDVEVPILMLDTDSGNDVLSTIATGDIDGDPAMLWLGCDPRGGRFHPGQSFTAEVCVVTTTEDNGLDSNPVPESLRYCIIRSTHVPGIKSITFDLGELPAGAKNHVISVKESPLPVVSREITIDALSAAGACKTTRRVGVPLSPTVLLDGSLLKTESRAGSVSMDGLILKAGGTLRGLAIDGFSRVGLAILGGEGWLIEWSHVRGCKSHGVFVHERARGGILRGVVAGSNGRHGFEIHAAGTNIMNCRVGVAADGLTRDGNGQDGVFLFSTASFSTIGDDPHTELPSTVIGDNGGAGVHTFARGTTVADVLIGVGDDGHKLLPNTLSGVVVSESASDSTIGRSAPTVLGMSMPPRTVISGNLEAGVVVFAPRTVISGVYVGVGRDGMTPRGNGRAGVIFADTAVGSVLGGGRIEETVVAGNSGKGFDSPTSHDGKSLTGLSKALIGIGADGKTRIANRGDPPPGPTEVEALEQLRSVAEEMSKIAAELEAGGNPTELFSLETAGNMINVIIDGSAAFYVGGQSWCNDPAMREVDTWADFGINRTPGKMRTTLANALQLLEDIIMQPYFPIVTDGALDQLLQLNEHLERDAETVKLIAVLQERPDFKDGYWGPEGEEGLIVLGHVATALSRVQDKEGALRFSLMAMHRAKSAKNGEIARVHASNAMHLQRELGQTKASLHLFNDFSRKPGAEFDNHQWKLPLQTPPWYFRGLTAKPYHVDFNFAEGSTIPTAVALEKHFPEIEREFKHLLGQSIRCCVSHKMLPTAH